MPRRLDHGHCYRHRAAARSPSNVPSVTVRSRSSMSHREIISRGSLRGRMAGIGTADLPQSFTSPCQCASPDCQRRVGASFPARQPCLR